ncbi:retinaldehyde-binding protein 1 [Trichonephila clavipes]|nr:retinaldehyde-binding protein 1 [Trichonephila clavipes]
MVLEKGELLPYVMDHLPPFFEEKARKELNETSEKKVSELLKLKQLAKSEDTICEINFTDDFLIQFLRHAKYDTQKAFSHLKNCIKLKRKYHYLFESVPEHYFSEIPSSKFCTILPLRCPDGCTITYCQIATRGLLATDHVILNHGQVTWTTPELAPPSPNYHTTPTG